MNRRFLIVLLALLTLVLAACGRSAPPVTVTPTPSPFPTATPTSTATFTPTPSPTPTPTPTPPEGVRALVEGWRAQGAPGEWGYDVEDGVWYVAMPVGLMAPDYETAAELRPVGEAEKEVMVPPELAVKLKNGEAGVEIGRWFVDEEGNAWFVLTGQVVENELRPLDESQLPEGIKMVDGQMWIAAEKVNEYLRFWHEEPVEIGGERIPRMIRGVEGVGWEKWRALKAKYGGLDGVDDYLLSRYKEDNPGSDLEGILHFRDLTREQAIRVKKYAARELFTDVDGEFGFDPRTDFEGVDQLTNDEFEKYVELDWYTGPRVVIHREPVGIAEERWVFSVVILPDEVNTGPNWYETNFGGGWVLTEFVGGEWYAINFDASIAESLDETQVVGIDEILSGALARWLRLASARLAAAEAQDDGGGEREVRPTFDDLENGGVNLWMLQSDDAPKSQVGLWHGELELSTNGNIVPMIAGAVYVNGEWRMLLETARQLGLDLGKWDELFIEEFVYQSLGGLIPRIIPIEGEDLGVAGEVWEIVAERLGNGDVEKGKEVLKNLAMEANRHDDLEMVFERLPWPESGFNPLTNRQ